MKPESTPKHILGALALTAVFNTLIAVFLTILRFRDVQFFTNFVFSQCIGLSICTCMLIVYHVLKPVRPVAQLLAFIGGMTAGSVAGIFLGTVFSGENPAVYFKEYGFFIQLVFFGLMFGSIISHFFISREKLAASENLVQQERIKRLTSEKKVVETNLRLLQAQVEPHFLFNTLSNILSLLDTNPHKGKAMLNDLILYLRTSLSKSREKVTTIGREMEMINAYINIFKVRMGDRLQCIIDVPNAVRHLSFPPMILQPLVENAIKHGLEPKKEGGKIFIKVAAEGDVLRVEVVDTGMGFNGNINAGIGLSNIRERLQAMYDDKARLVLEEYPPSGLKAIIEVPHAIIYSHNCR